MAAVIFLESGHSAFVTTEGAQPVPTVTTIGGTERMLDVTRAALDLVSKSRKPVKPDPTFRAICEEVDRAFGCEGPVNVPDWATYALVRVQELATAYKARTEFDDGIEDELDKPRPAATRTPRRRGMA